MVAQADGRPLHLLLLRRGRRHGGRRRLGRRARRAHGQVQVQVEVGAPRRVRAPAAAAVAVLRRRRAREHHIGRDDDDRARGPGGCRRLRREAGGAGRGEPASRGGATAERAVRLRVDAPAQQLALDVRVPVVLDLVVRPAGQLPRDERPPARCIVDWGSVIEVVLLGQEESRANGIPIMGIYTDGWRTAALTCCRAGRGA